MKKPTKVVVTITGEGYATEVFEDEAVLARRSSKMVNAHNSKGEQKGDFYDDFDEDWEDHFGVDLPRALEGIDSEAFGVASALREISDLVSGKA